MTPTTQSPETRARELAESMYKTCKSFYAEQAINLLTLELTTLITKADALDWLEENGEWILGNRMSCKLPHSTVEQTLLSAITEAMEGRE